MKRLLTLFYCALIIVPESSPQEGWFWQNPLPQGNGLSSVSFVNELTGWTVGEYGTILRTTDGGINWTLQSSGTIETLTGVSFTDSDYGTAVGGPGTILRTTDGGTTWTEQLSGTTEWLEGVSFTDSVNGTAVGFLGKILRTTNGGTTWTSQSSSTTTEWLKAVSFTDSDNGTAVGRNGTIIRTTDGGTTWTVQPSGTTHAFDGVSFTDSDNGTVVGGFSNPVISYIFRTTNGGTTWTSQVIGITGMFTGVSFTDANNGTVVGLGGAILRTTNGGVSFVEEQEISEIPMTHNLTNNFPNPFNPSTKIKYSVPQTANVIIKVFDILGNEIETLVNEQKNSGTYEITWYAEQLPSGIYFYRLQAGSFVETKKMVLLR
jgi:photosystem II stability/assembly factor-like uncharacterized protein